MRPNACCVRSARKRVSPSARCRWRWEILTEFSIPADSAEILFGEKRHGAETVKVSLVATYHARQQEGKDCLERLVRR